MSGIAQKAEQSKPTEMWVHLSTVSYKVATLLARTRWCKIVWRLRKEFQVHGNLGALDLELISPLFCPVRHSGVLGGEENTVLEVGRLSYKSKSFNSSEPQFLLL